MAQTARASAIASTIDGAGNGAKRVLDLERPYVADVEVEGTTTLLFHRYNVEAVAARAESAPGSLARKLEDPEELVWRTKTKTLGIPGEYFLRSIIEASSFVPSPRASRGSARPVYRAGVFCLTELADLGLATWDTMDSRRAIVNRAAIPRLRPAVFAGWRARFQVEVVLPNYIAPHGLHSTISMAGRLVGVGDFRPTFGRFAVINFSYNFEG